MQTVWNALTGLDFPSLVLGLVIGCAMTWCAAWDWFEATYFDRAESAGQEDAK